MQARAGALGGAVLVAICVAWVAMWLTGSRVLAADNTGVITGVVTSAKGPEAGVWVIAETDDLPTRFRKIVVTDDRGPLPAAGAAEGRQLQGLGARLRPRRFEAGDRASRSGR